MSIWYGDRYNQTRGYDESTNPSNGWRTPEVEMETDPRLECERLGHDYPEKMNRHCGAYICNRCDDHKGLARCFCGWSAGGGNGYEELVEMGEQIEEDY